MAATTRCFIAAAACSRGFEPKLAIRMAGKEVFKIAVTKLGAVVDETLAANGLDRTAIDWLVPHQANIRIVAGDRLPDLICRSNA